MVDATINSNISHFRLQIPRMILEKSITDGSCGSPVGSDTGYSSSAIPALLLVVSVTNGNVQNNHRGNKVGVTNYGIKTQSIDARRNDFVTGFQS